MSLDIQCKAFSVLPQCSNHGNCDLSKGLCRCDDGWTSIGDFSSQFGIHCGINKLVIRILWIFTLATAFVLFYFSSKLIILKYKSNNNNSKKQGISITTDPANVAVINFSISSIMGATLSLLKIVDQESFAVGLNLVSTTILFLYFTISIVGVNAYIITLVNFILRFLKAMSKQSKDAIKDKNRVIKRGAYFIISISPFASSPVFLNFVYPNHDYESVVSVILPSLIMSLFMLFSLVRYFTVIENEIGIHLKHMDQTEITKNSSTNHSTNDPLVNFKNNLRKSRIILFSLGIQVLILYILFVNWDILIVNSSYLWPIVTSTINIVTSTFLKSMMNKSKTSISSEHLNSKDKKEDLDVVVGNAETQESPNNSKPVSDNQAIQQLGKIVPSTDVSKHTII